MAIRSKRKEIDEQKVYCRKCMTLKKPTDFFVATDEYIDGNGRMSVCSACCNLIYNNIYNAEKNISKSLLRCCRMLNVRFDEDAVEATKTHLNTLAQSGKETSNVFGIYKGKILSSAKKNFSDKNSTLDLTFYEPNIMIKEESMTDEEELETENLDLIWGCNLSFDDYQFLEKEFDEWKRTHRCDTKAEKTLIREICHKELEIRKKRLETQGHAPGNLIKELQDLMKTANVDPSKTSEANSGKNKERYSKFEEILEENEPADYYADKKMYSNFDNQDFILKKYVTRPIKNFITQSRDFNVDAEDDVDEIVESEFEKDEHIT
jgi:hypothetical protein